MTELIFCGQRFSNELDLQKTVQHKYNEMKNSVLLSNEYNLLKKFILRYLLYRIATIGTRSTTTLELDSLCCLLFWVQNFCCDKEPNDFSVFFENLPTIDRQENISNILQIHSLLHRHTFYFEMIASLAKRYSLVTVDDVQSKKLAAVDALVYCQMWTSTLCDQINRHL